MKVIIIALSLFAAGTKFAIPVECIIEMEGQNNNVTYSVVGWQQTNDILNVIIQLETLIKIAEEKNHTEGWCFTLLLNGDIDLSVILQIKEALTPFGYNHSVIHICPKRGPSILITKGKSELEQFLELHSSLIREERVKRKSEENN